VEEIKPVCFRWFPFAADDGSHNMAADEVLLGTAAEKGIASLRVYGWTKATVSLGYFQPAEVRARHARWAQLPWVRRPSGGKTLVHHHELTYALALPAGFDPGWMPRMHERVILPALARLGLVGRVSTAQCARLTGEVLCFEEQAPGDLVCSESKVTGSAQRKHRRGLLQHGAILLAQSEFAPELPGIKELTGVDLSVEVLQEVLLAEFRRETAWDSLPGTWSAEEERTLGELAAQKYGAPEWNDKR
jgi:lipoate-protein ligase A